MLKILFEFNMFRVINRLTLSKKKKKKKKKL